MGNKNKDNYSVGCFYTVFQNILHQQKMKFVILTKINGTKTLYFILSFSSLMRVVFELSNIRMQIKLSFVLMYAICSRKI